MPSRSEPRPRGRLLRISLRLLMLLVTACCVAAWYWQRPYEVEGTHKMFTGMVNGQPTFAQGRRVESLRRAGFGAPVKHGPTRLYNLDGEVFFEAGWQYGVRDGLFRRWDEESGELVAELEFEMGRLVRFGDTYVRDFLADFQADENSRVAVELQKETSFEYTDQSLRDVVNDISFRHDLPLAFNLRVLNDAGVPVTSPVSVSFHGVPLFAALCVLLAPLDLTCVYQYETLWITTEDDDSLNESRINLENMNPDLKKTFDQKTAVEYLDVALSDVLADISGEHGLLLDNRADAERHDRVALSMRGRSLRSVLGLILYQTNLYGNVQDGVLIVQQGPEATVKTRVATESPVRDQAASRAKEIGDAAVDPFAPPAAKGLDPFAPRE